MGLTGSPAYGRVGHGMGNLFPVHLGGKRRFKGLKTKMSRKSMRFCKLWPSLGCVLLTVIYGTPEVEVIVDNEIPQSVCDVVAVAGCWESLANEEEHSHLRSALMRKIIS